jgi:hypothetical protein
MPRVSPFLSVLLVAVAAVVPPAIAVAPVTAAAQDDARRPLARELAGLMLAGESRRTIEDQVGALLAQSMGAALQDRLNRQLQDGEVRALSGIVRRFVSETLRDGRTEAIAAEVYAQQFETAELRELVAFHASPVGRKVQRLAPVIALETVAGIEREIRTSAAVPQMLEELRRVFPVLGTGESP